MNVSLPVVTDEMIRNFAGNNVTQTVIPVKTTGRFVIPIPKLDDGSGPLNLPNVKELEMIIKSGFGSKITSAILESSPQIVPTDGSNVVIINNITHRQAHAFQVTHDDILKENSGKMNRKSLIDFFEIITGISYNPVFNIIDAVSDNIGIHGDVFNQERDYFKRVHHPYGIETDLTGLADSEIRAGYYNKIPSPVQGFAISGGFIREAEAGTQQTFPNTAMIQVGIRVSAIHRNDINLSYATVDGEKLVDDTGKINLPTYPIEQILLAQRNAPSKPITT